jgi:hypothetical protein
MAVQLVTRQLGAPLACERALSAVSLYATAGMRLAEQKAGTAAVGALYAHLRDAISGSLGALGYTVAADAVRAKTLTGAEEGLFTWMTVNGLKRLDGRSAAYEGILEIGGASAQIAFPCPTPGEACGAESYPLQIDGRKTFVYSHSWLGLGLTEAYRVLNAERGWPCTQHSKGEPGMPSAYDEGACRRSVESIFTGEGAGLRLADPLNFVSPTADRIGGTAALALPPSIKLHAVGALGFLDVTALDTEARAICPVSLGDLKSSKATLPGLKNERDELLPLACFTRVYASALLKRVPNLELSGNARKIAGVSVDWTFGAAVCELTSCMQGVSSPCQWNKGWVCAGEG